MNAAANNATSRSTGTAAPLLAVQDVHKTFGAMTVVDGCSFTLHRGRVTGLVGPNGAGKSTLFNLITGAQRPDRGRIVFDGRAMAGRSPEHIVNHGIGRTFQTPRLLHELTAWENLMIAGRKQPGEHFWATLIAVGRWRNAELALSDRAHRVLAFLQLERLLDEPAASLSGGQRKLLSLGRVLMMRPRLILLDEPAAGVNETLAQE